MRRRPTPDASAAPAPGHVAPGAVALSADSETILGDSIIVGA